MSIEFDLSSAEIRGDLQRGEEDVEEKDEEEEVDEDLKSGLCLEGFKSRGSRLTPRVRRSSFAERGAERERKREREREREREENMRW